ncbi:hypothetical protein C7S16_5266 [Burkholderia thailandensis]|uniref:Uncharacterized protein n=1 Tax=Burkholderia thailandensis TaxID=57975 RepID=A0AAW9CRT5_BURTH|nr:hypothetical protein [Burkholderia thailandensis]MDW9251778.1 hypothetical protein [Burkholderia thailandensis]
MAMARRAAVLTSDAKRPSRLLRKPNDFPAPHRSASGA